jgi:hypothetical protein
LNDQSIILRRPPAFLINGAADERRMGQRTLACGMAE